MKGFATSVATLTFSKYDLVFGPVMWNTAAELSSVVTNTGTLPATFSSFTFSGSGAQYYTLIANTCAGGLEPGNSCTLTVPFTPGTLAQTSPTLTIVDNARNGESIIIASGTGRKSVTITPKALSFGSHKVGSNTTRIINFTNAGNPLAVAASIMGNNPSDFSFTSTCLGIVPKGTCAITVTFTPRAQGIRLGNSCIHRRRFH